MTDKNVINLLRKWFPVQLATACISEYLHVPRMIEANSTFWLIFFLNHSLLGWINSGGIVTEELSIIVWTPRIEKKSQALAIVIFVKYSTAPGQHQLSGFVPGELQSELFPPKAYAPETKFQQTKVFLVQKHHF